MKKNKYYSSILVVSIKSWAKTNTTSYRVLVLVFLVTSCKNMTKVDK